MMDSPDFYLGELVYYNDDDPEEEDSPIIETGYIEVIDFLSTRKMINLLCSITDKDEFMSGLSNI